MPWLRFSRQATYTPAAMTRPAPHSMVPFGKTVQTAQSIRIPQRMAVYSMGATTAAGELRNASVM